MPGTEKDKQNPVETPELPDAVFGDQEGLSRAGPPSWCGVDMSAGDKSDATKVGVSEEDVNK